MSQPPHRAWLLALVGVLGPLNLMLVSALILELAVRASHVLDSAEAGMRTVEGNDEAIAGSARAAARNASIAGGWSHR